MTDRKDLELQVGRELEAFTTSFEHLRTGQSEAGLREMRAQLRSAKQSLRMSDPKEIRRSNNALTMISAGSSLGIIAGLAVATATTSVGLPLIVLGGLTGTGLAAALKSLRDARKISEDASNEVGGGEKT